MPECRINLAVNLSSPGLMVADKQHCVAYLAEAPKSTRSYNAYKRVGLSLGCSEFG
jgi:replication-associated recombination protein RarA